MNPLKKKNKKDLKWIDVNLKLEKPTKILNPLISRYIKFIIFYCFFNAMFLYQ